MSRAVLNAIDVAIGVLMIAIALGGVALFVRACRGTAHAQPALERAGRVGAAETVSGQQPALVGSAGSLEHALLVQVRLGRDHTGPFARHCRHAPGGCERWIARVALDMRMAAAHWEVSPWTMAAIAVRESSLNPAAVGARNEHGVMQLLPGTPWERDARRRCREAPSDCVAVEIDVAAELLARSVQLCGSEARALGRYSCGRCEETAYSRSVLALRDRLRGAS